MITPADFLVWTVRRLCLCFLRQLSYRIVIFAVLAHDSPHGNNNALELPFGTSLYALEQRSMPPARDLGMLNDLRVFLPEAALIRVPEAMSLEGSPRWRSCSVASSTATGISST